MYMQLPNNNSHMTAGLNVISAEEAAEVGCLFFFFHGYFSKLEAVFQVYPQSLSSCLPQLF